MPPYSTTITFIAIILFLALTGFILFVFYQNKYKNIKATILSIFDRIKTNLYLYLLPFPIFYLIFYYTYLNIDLDSLNNGKHPFFYNVEVVEYLKSISIMFFSAGIFSATLKLINSLVIFKKQFKEIIISNEFKNVLAEELETIALSDNYLLKRSDLENVWARVTICRFEQAFPLLKNQIINKLENDFFNDKMLTYYYDNFRIQINLELLNNNIVKITEVSNFKIISKSTNNIDLEFKLSSDSIDNEEIYTKLIKEDCKIDGKIMEFQETSLINNKNKVFSINLKGKNDYIVERKIELTQNLDEDRVFSFSSSIIIDNMNINIKTCEKLRYFFSPSGKNKFNKDNHIGNNDTFVNREVLLPGEKFKLFIFKSIK